MVNDWSIDLAWLEERVIDEGDAGRTFYWFMAWDFSKRACHRVRDTLLQAGFTVTLWFDNMDPTNNQFDVSWEKDDDYVMLASKLRGSL